MKWWFLCWLVLSVDSCKTKNEMENQDEKQKSKHQYPRQQKTPASVTKCMEDVSSILKNGNRRKAIEAMQSLEQFLEEAEVTEAESLFVNNIVAFLHKPEGPFEGLDIYANDIEAMSHHTAPTDSKVNVRLPRELDAESGNTIVFCMLTLPEPNVTASEVSENLYENRLVGLSVQGKRISGLQERVNITINLNKGINDTQEPRCVFLNFSTQEYSTSGCQTLWTRGQSHITCSCDHLTYFGVLMVTVPLSSIDRETLSYITLTGCSLSLFALVLTVLLFIMNKKVRADVSMKVHINLAVALILLNVHFLSSHAVAALSSTGLCIYVALSLHYSLLATFSWMALEGFHLYLLLVRVFNIYVRRYLLKLSVVGWGFPAVIVSLVAIIDRNTYGPVPLDSSNPNSTVICYIGNYTVKIVATVGVFSLVFVFNVIMLGVTTRRVMSLRQSKKFGQRDYNRAKQDICTLLGVNTLLGIMWGLIFFSFGYLTTVGLYPFCILNSLQGFFIFLWFLMSSIKISNSAPKTSSETRSTNS
uniref:adhesion G-protein coupled receptor G1-like n=1 Tax=Scatophagus argus TaxID=75038 RepID=UPI001ED7D187|nr:adhesion G-protein coupled receptor G1-like [Scatophagus argus]XP_046254176.1 adhesion G-protein coupled receptor G1-like [Scatophagus argus]